MALDRTWLTPLVDDSGAGTDGSIVNKALLTAIADAIDALPLGGAWNSVTFATGNFTGSGSMTWTVASGDQVAFRYIVVGKLMTVFFDIRTTTVGGTPNTALQIAIPGGYAAGNDNISLQPIRVFDNGTAAVGFAQVRNTGAGIQLFRSIDGGTNWSAATDTTSVQGTITFQVA